MPLFEHSPETHEVFVREVTESFPGGQHIAGHVDEGPWEWVIAEDPRDIDDVHWLANYAMTAYPNAVVPGIDNNGDFTPRWTALLPKFAADLVRWYGDEAWPVDYDTDTPDHYETQPEPATAQKGIVMALIAPTHLNRDGSVGYCGYHQQLSDLIDTHGVEHVVEHLNQVRQDTWAAKEVGEYVAAWAAANL